MATQDLSNFGASALMDAAVDAAVPTIAVEPRLYTSVAAKVIGVCPRTLTRWSEDGKIAYSRVGNRFFYRVDELKRFLAECEHPRQEDVA